MIQQRVISLNPNPERLEAVKITYPPDHSRQAHWKIEPMRFIPHDGLAKTRLPEPEPQQRHRERPQPIARPLSRTWCVQCEALVTGNEAYACGSAFCKAKAA